LLNSAFSQDSEKNKPVSYKLLTTISIPNLTGFDISWVDSEAGRYYLANRGNTTVTPPVGPNITVIDTEHVKLLDPIPLTTAPNGVVAIQTGDDKEKDKASTLVVGGSDSTAIFIDLSKPSSQFPVHTGGNRRADELAYDPVDHIILIAN